MSESKDASGVPGASDSVAEQETTNTATVSDSGDTVKYDTYRRTLGEAKKAKAELEETTAKLNALEKAKLEEDGKWREAYEKSQQDLSEAKSKYASTMGGVVKGNAMAAILDEARKAGFQGSRNTLEALVSDKIKDFDFDDQLRPVQDSVLAVVKHVREVEPRLFGTDAPKVADHKLNPIDSIAPAGPRNVKNAKDEELMALWAKAHNT